jgi:hypothetical protein
MRVRRQSCRHRWLAWFVQTSREYQSEEISIECSSIYEGFPPIAAQRPGQHSLLRDGGVAQKDKNSLRTIRGEDQIRSFPAAHNAKNFIFPQQPIYIISRSKSIQDRSLPTSSYQQVKAPIRRRGGVNLFSDRHQWSGDWVPWRKFIHANDIITLIYIRCRHLDFLESRGSTWYMSPPWMLICPICKISLVSSWLYAIYIAADEIYKIHVVSALRDLHRRWWDL